MTVSFTQKVNQRAAGAEATISNEAHTVSLVTPFTVKLLEVPLQDAPSTVIVPGYTETTSVIPLAGQFYVKYSTGYLTFHSSAAGALVYVSYEGRGSIVDAQDINDVQTVLAAFANEVEDARGSEVDLDSRLSVSLQADGTLVDGIVVPDTISTNPADNFVFPGDLTAATITVPVLTTAPVSPAVGQIWYDSTDEQFYGRGASGTVILG